MDICLMIEGGRELGPVAHAGRDRRGTGVPHAGQSDHYQSFARPTEWGTHDAWTTLAALAMRTERLRLGTMVSPVTFRHPSVVAKSVVTVDHASGGRVDLGMGAGWFEREHEAFGFPFPPPAERFAILEESVEIVHRLWDRDEPSVTFHGEHFRLDDVTCLPRPMQDPHPPLILGGDAGQRSVALAARWADEYNVHGRSPEQIREIRDRLDAACEAIGRDPATLRRSLMITTVVGDDRAAVVAAVERVFERQDEVRDADAYVAADDPTDLIGTPPRILERLQAFAAEGIQKVLLQDLLHDDMDMLALIGREVIPAASGL
ncbi:MAG: TIGR03560 family F420-dependent LLM class oxidoreductase [Actinomycetota bacterium]